MVGIKNDFPFRALGDKVFLSVDEDVERNKKGIIAPDVSNDKPLTGLVVAVGEEVKSVKVGDKVIFDPFILVERKHKGIKYFVLKENKIDAVIK